MREKLLFVQSVLYPCLPICKITHIVYGLFMNLWLYIDPTSMLGTVIALYRAAEWDLPNPSWKGRMRIVAKGDQCIVKLEDKISGE